MANNFVDGIDVSLHQGCIEWGAVAPESVSFGFARATVGGHRSDPQFAANSKRISEAGIVRGAYHFFWPLTPWERQHRRDSRVSLSAH